MGDHGHDTYRTFVLLLRIEYLYVRSATISILVLDALWSSCFFPSALKKGIQPASHRCAGASGQAGGPTGRRAGGQAGGQAGRQASLT